MQPSISICVATPSLDTYSETFIRDHIRHLPFGVHTLSGAVLDSGNGEWLLAKTKLRRLFDLVGRKIDRYNHETFSLQRRTEWLCRNKIQVVLAEYGFTGQKLISVCRNANVPLVVHFHGFDAHNREAIDANVGSYQELFDAATAVVGVSRFMIDKLVTLGCNPSKLHYIPYFVSPEEFRQCHPATKGPKILAVGRFVEKKAPHLTILAFSKVLKEIPNARLEMVGDGSLLGPACWLARSLRIDHAVTFHGAKNQEWIIRAMRRSRLFVQHSVEAINGDSEGTPVAVLEAQCSGLPVVATRHAGIADVVLEGYTGFLCAEGDSDTMASNMIRVLKMRENEMRKMSANARQRILDHFGKVQTIDRLAEVIQNSVQTVFNSNGSP